MAALPFNLLTIVSHVESSRHLGFTSSHCPGNWEFASVLINEKCFLQLLELTLE